MNINKRKEVGKERGDGTLIVFDDLRIFGRSTKLEASIIISITSIGKVGNVMMDGEDAVFKVTLR